jgi:hypothetical protein
LPKHVSVAKFPLSPDAEEGISFVKGWHMALFFKCKSFIVYLRYFC